MAKPIDKNNHNQLAKVGARALAALQHGVDPNGQQQFLVYPAMGLALLIYVRIFSFF